MLEHPIEVENLDKVGKLLEFDRANFVWFIFNGSWNSVTHRDSMTEFQIPLNMKRTKLASRIRAVSPSVQVLYLDPSTL